MLPSRAPAGLPSAATIMRTRMSPGKDASTSRKRWTMRSTHPPKYAEKTPIAVPRQTPRSVDETATAIETWAP